jgi:hypothetical protein
MPVIVFNRENSYLECVFLAFPLVATDKMCSNFAELMINTDYA